MRKSKLRFFFAALAAFLIGVPLTEKALADGVDIAGSAWNLALAIVNSATRG
jgi:hypothetical protein